jgi:hypothetical protein
VHGCSTACCHSTVCTACSSTARQLYLLRCVVWNSADFVSLFACCRRCRCHNEPCAVSTVCCQSRRLCLQHCMMQGTMHWLFLAVLLVAGFSSIASPAAGNTINLDALTVETGVAWTPKAAQPSQTLGVNTAWPAASTAEQFMANQPPDAAQIDSPATCKQLGMRIPAVARRLLQPLCLRRVLRCCGSTLHAK